MEIFIVYFTTDLIVHNYIKCNKFELRLKACVSSETWVFNHKDDSYTISYQPNLAPIVMVQQRNFTWPNATVKIIEKYLGNYKFQILAIE